LLVGVGCIIALADNAFVCEAGVGEAFQCLHMMRMRFWWARLSLSPQIPSSGGTRKISMYSIPGAIDLKRSWSRWSWHCSEVEGKPKCCKYYSGWGGGCADGGRAVVLEILGILDSLSNIL
jgi:hypothetical protein